MLNSSLIDDPMFPDRRQQAEGQEASVEPEAPTLTSLSHQMAAITDKMVSMQGQLNLLTGMATQTHTKMVLQACQTAACEAYAIAGSRPSSGEDFGEDFERIDQPDEPQPQQQQQPQQQPQQQLTSSSSSSAAQPVIFGHPSPQQQGAAGGREAGDRRRRSRPCPRRRGTTRRSAGAGERQHGHRRVLSLREVPRISWRLRSFEHGLCS